MTRTPNLPIQAPMPPSTRIRRLTVRIWLQADVLGLAPLLAEHGAIYVTAISTLPFDPAGRVMDYPPLHIHHSHLGPWRNPGVQNMVPFSFPHGDSYCLPEDGGMGCLLTTFPEGQCAARAPTARPPPTVPTLPL